MSRILTIQVYRDVMLVTLDECFLIFHRIIVPATLQSKKTFLLGLLDPEDKVTLIL